MFEESLQKMSANISTRKTWSSMGEAVYLRELIVTMRHFLFNVP